MTRPTFTLPVAFIFFSIVSFFSSSCSYVTPEAENPNPGLEKLSTDFQVKDGTISLRKRVIGYEINQKTNTVKNTRKNWLCGWAPVTQSGSWHGVYGLSHSPYRSRHCNMEFRISKDGKNLEARSINLNFLNDYERWPLLFTIPIKQHFFYEKDVDSRGRQLNKYKKVTDRKNWQLAPIMDLDLKGIHFHDLTRRPHASRRFGSPPSQVTDVFDIEVSKEDSQQFLAFNGTLVNSAFGSKVQHVYRFNFLEIKENPNFKKTPYNSRNAKHMNILHILGYQPNGFDEVNYAAHWDVSEPVEFCLNGFPDDSRNYKKVAEDVLEEANKAMVKIGAVKEDQKAFIISKKQPKYHFDLRCPSITWVDDAILSLRAPLGIGLVNTNIKTGEILWGGAVIWGGLIDRIVNNYSEPVADAILQNTHDMMIASETSQNSSRHNNSYFEDIQGHLNIKSMAHGFTTLKDVVNSNNSHINISDILHQLQKRNERINESIENMNENKDDNSKSSQYMTTKRKELVKEIDKTNSHLKYLSRFNPHSVMKLSLDDQDLDYDNTYQPESEEEYIQGLIAGTGLGTPIDYTDEEKQKFKYAQSKNMSLEKVQSMIKEQLSQQHIPFDADNTLENYYDEISVAVSNMNGMERLKATRSFIKNVTLHELGHVIGLGHQFEANHMPKKGMVPSKIYNELATEVPRLHNYSSIMDYMSGITGVSLPYEKVKMKIQDELTLSYLYNQEYSSYKSGDENFTFFKVPPNGVIPNQTIKGNNAYRTRYMPQCSDLDAWLATNPYCRRWDRGHDAPSLVKENLKSYTDSFIKQMNSFTEATGGSPHWAQYRLWRKTYDLMNHNRTFYDNMRYHLANNKVYRSVFDKLKKDEEALLSFTKACIDPSSAKNDTWGVEFTKLAIEPLMSETEASTLQDLQEKQVYASDDSPLSYKNIYHRYKNIAREYSIHSLDQGEKAMDNLETKLNKNGLAFSELQKLCRASKKSLDVANLLLSLKGEDHTIMDYDTAISPTGLRGGQASYDYSRLFGTYDQLGLLPIKIATLDVLTNTSSTMRYRWWNIGKPMYNDSNEGKFGYFSLYPKEFTSIISTTIKNNMKFGGSQLQETANMSIANLYMNYFLFRTFFMSNDNQSRGFNSNYLKNLKEQTHFHINLVAILLETIDISGEPKNKRFGFRPKLFNPAKRSLVDLPEAYVLPEKRVIVRGNDSQIIIPITKMRFIDQRAAYVWAIEVSYDKTSYDDPLQGFTVKNVVSELSTQELNKCMSGSKGLGSFFNSNEEFSGFQIDPGIATDPDAQTNFEKTLNEGFKVYHSRKGLRPDQLGCEESVKGVGLIASTALSLNGFFLQQIYEYIKK